MWAQTLDFVLVLVLLLNFFALGASRLRTVIIVVAWQGALLGCMPVLVHGGFNFHVLFLGAALVGVKAILIPRLLFYAMREVQLRREVEPIVGFVPSLVLGVVGTGLAVAFAETLPLGTNHVGSLVVPASLATVLTGFLMLTTRRKAITQAVGYLVLENGIFLFGLLLVEAMPFLVEIGVLLDVFVGILVMGIIIHQVNREFSSVSTQYLSSLRE
jgi:hydrogenase-4 component E